MSFLPGLAGFFLPRIFGRGSFPVPPTFDFEAERKRKAEEKAEAIAEEEARYKKRKKESEMEQYTRQRELHTAKKKLHHANFFKNAYSSNPGHFLTNRQSYGRWAEKDFNRQNVDTSKEYLWLNDEDDNVEESPEKDPQL